MANITDQVHKLGKQNRKRPGTTTNIPTVPVSKYLSKYSTHIFKPHNFGFFNTISLIMNQGQGGRSCTKTWLIQQAAICSHKYAFEHHFTLL